MRVLVTGGAGKIGRFVVRELLEALPDARLTVLDLAAGPEHARVDARVGDIVDPEQVAAAVEGVEVVVHLAAVHKYGIAPDDVTYRTNVMGTFNVHAAARRLGVRRVVSTSSEAVLGWDYAVRPFPPERLPIDESHPTRPQDAYGLSKIAGELTARSHTDCCDLETVVLRPPWVLTPETAAQLRAEGGQQATRFLPFSYVDVRDLAVAYRLAVLDRTPGHHVCFVAAPDSTVSEPLATLLPRLVPEIGDMARDFTDLRSAICTDRIRALLGWQARHTWRVDGEWSAVSGQGSVAGGSVAGRSDSLTTNH